MTTDKFFKGNNFVFNSFVLKEVYKYNLSLDEFILFVYFLNLSNPIFNVDEISKSTGMCKDSILKAFNMLIEKKIIDLVTNKDKDGIIYEYISLDSFYKSVDDSILKNKSEVSVDDIKGRIENDLSISCSKSDLEIIKAWINNGFTKETINEAINEAKINGLNSFRYLDKILYEWREKGIKSVDDESTYLKKKSDENNNQKLFDYDWLDENN